MQQRLCLLVVIVLLAVGLTGALLYAQAGNPPAATTTPARGTTAPLAGAAAPAAETTTPVETAIPAQVTTEPKTQDPMPVTPDVKELKVFGHDLFNTADNTFEPNNDAPVPPDYVMSTGDTLAVVCWFGSTEYEHTNVTITPGGDVYLKLVGAIPLANKTFAQAEEELRKQYARFYKKFNLKVQLVGRRTIPIFVMGEVEKPGKYMLSSLSTVFTALYAAKGPAKSGSLRRIRLMRGQRQVAEIDIYAYLLRGAMVDLPLQAGDTIFIPLAGKVVIVDGDVRRPAKYELLDKDTLGDAVALAGGTAPTSADRVSMARIGENQARLIVDLKLSEHLTYPLRDGDEIRVLPVLPYVRNAVHLVGAVNRPGDYPIEKAPTISALMALSEGATPEAYLEQAIIERLDSRMERSQLPINLRAILENKAGADVTLQPNDTVRIYKRGELAELNDTVHINGEVVKPGLYPFKAGMRVSDLTQQAFGPTTDAYLSQVYVYRYPVGDQPQMLTINLAKALSGDKAENVELNPRDRLLIRKRQEVTDLLVRVEGEVEKPGVLTFYNGMKVSDAIFIAGGLKPNVAMDRALLIRLNEQNFSEELVDLSLRSVLSHDPAHDISLRNNDRLVVYPVDQMGENRVVTIDGAVVEPGSYPYTGNMRIGHLLFLAKGLRQDAYAQRADLYRVRPDNSLEVIPISLIEAATGVLSDANPLLKPRDRLVVATNKDLEDARVVKIDGYVRKPGTYPLTVGMKFSDLLHLAGGVKPQADPKVELYRLTGDTVRTTPITLTEAIDGIMTPDVDPVLQPNDLISVRGNAGYVKITETIAVEGEVQHPGVYPAYEGSRQSPRTLYQLLTQAGGILPETYPAGIVLYRQQTAIHTFMRITTIFRLSPSAEMPPTAFR